MVAVGASAADPKKNCDDVLNRARSDFKKLYDQKKYPSAVQKLKAAINNCSAPANEDLFCWAYSDLALGLLKSGDAQACRDELAPKVVPNVTCRCCGASIDDGKNASAAEKAAYHNYDLCQRATTSDFNKFKSAACPLKLPARTLSSSLIPSKSKDETQCVALVATEYGKDFYTPNIPGLEDKLEEDPQIICPKIVRLKLDKTTSLKSEELSLSANDEVLGDSTFCCQIDRLDVSEEKGRLKLHVVASDGPNQPCGGSGTARATAEGLYEIDNGKLVLKKNMSEAIH